MLVDSKTFVVFCTGVSMSEGDNCNEELLEHVLVEFQPDLVVNFATESLVDRSINETSPSSVQTFLVCPLCWRPCGD